MSPKNKSYDKRIMRLMFILNKLDSGKTVSSAELAKEFNVTLRTVQRDLVILDMAGYALISMEKGQHSFMEGFSLKRVMLSDKEAALLSMLYDMASSLGKNFESSFRDILRKVLAKDQGSPFYVKIPEGMKLDEVFRFGDELVAAIEERRKIEVSYLVKDEEKEFKVRPLKIISFAGFWYLLLGIDGKKGMFKFRLENIKKVKTLNEYFEVPANLKTVLGQSVNIWFSDKRDKTITVKIDKEAARYFKKKVYFPLQKIVKENRDGSLVIETKVEQYMEVIPIILGWIPYIQPLNPGDFKDQVKAMVTEYLQKS